MDLVEPVGEPFLDCLVDLGGEVPEGTFLCGGPNDMGWFQHFTLPPLSEWNPSPVRVEVNPSPTRSALGVHSDSEQSPSSLSVIYNSNKFIRKSLKISEKSCHPGYV